MAKTFLQLAAALRQECAGSGTGPVSVTGQTGELKRFCDWIAQADEEIQQERDNWRFMVGAFTLNTVSGDGSYAAVDCIPPVTDLRDWLPETIKIYLLSAGVAGESFLSFIPYAQWYAIYNTGTQINGRPVHYTVGNDMSLKLGPAPDDVYRISGEYKRSATAMTANTDTPSYPSEFHMLPVYLAMMKYGRYTGAGEVYSDGERLYKNMLGRLELNQLPCIEQAGALA